ncbi:MAG TPA: lipoprotein insertase outer membrane protein LolB [Burkholderiaceae bacterium]|jgi:outer membrane lipoprotein LolB|nr:lipoprotein insertase outer membrane protein LolB [Burkholderiaceae bacterium]
MHWTVCFFDFARCSRRYAIAALALSLVACAGIPPRTIPGVTPATQVVPEFHDVLDLDGRLSVSYQQNGRDEAVHGSFVWVQTPGHTTVHLLTPFGQTMAAIDVTPQAATLTQAGRPPRIAQDADALAAETLGWPLPISGLRHWLQGFVIDAQGRHIFAAVQNTGTASFTTRDGWRVRYVSWASAAPSSAQNRPKRIDLDRSTTQAGKVSIRIVIDNWKAR